MKIEDINWEEVQLFYNDNKTWRDICKFFNSFSYPKSFFLTKLYFNLNNKVTFQNNPQHFVNNIFFCELHTSFKNETLYKYLITL